MDFYAVLDQIVALLQQRGRVSYQALKRQFNLDDAYIDDLKVELIDAQQVARDENGRVLVWVSEAAASPGGDTASAPTPPLPTPPLAPQRPEAERRQLTVMFCDLVGSTPLSKRLDPEDLREVVRAYQHTCAEVIQHFHGHVAQLLGDALLVYFGWPQAHEDSTQRAVHAGIGMIEAMRTLNTRLEREYGIRLGIRVGMHTGLVVIGEMGGGEYREQLALGEAPNIAARIQGFAEPDTVLLSADTYRLVQGYFTVEDLGPQALKGVAVPMRVYRVLAQSGAQSRMDVATAVGLTPLVGRDSEIALLLERWAQVQEGRGQVVLLSGEAGIGKSRLLQALQGHIAQKSHTRLECRSSPYYQNSALYPLVDLLQRFLQGPPDEVLSGALERLEELLAPCDLATAEVVPLFTTLLALPLPANRYTPLALSAEQHRHKTLEALLAFVLAQTAHQPVVFLLEDLHWTDPSTLEWLTLLIEQSPTASILTLLTCRPEFQPPWGGKSHLTPLTLQRLTRVQIEAMVARVTGGKTLPGDVLQHLIEKSDGVPLYVEEMTKAILESGVLKTSNGHYTLSAPLTALAIPSTLQDSLMARLDRLGDAKGIAQLGATLGRQFAYAVLQAVAQADEAAVQQALRCLVEAELVYQRGVLPEATYTFKHALIQDIAYQSLLKSLRQQHHQRIVQVLEAHFPEIVNSQPALLAHHAWHGEVWDKALRYFRQAGADAVQQSAYQEAVVCFEQALDALQHLPEGRDTRELAIDLRLNLRSAIMPLWQYDRLLTTLREADALAEALGDPHRLARVAAYLTHALFLTGESKQAFIAGQRAVSLSAPLKDGSFQREARFRMAQVSFILGQYGLAIEGFRQNVDALVHERIQETSGGAREAVLYLRWLAQPLAEIGRFPESMARGEEAVRIAEEIVHPFSLSNAYVGAGYLSLRKGDVSRAVAFYTRGMDLCRRRHILQMLHGHALGLCVALGMSGQVTEALALLEQVVLQPPSPGLGVSGMPESPTLGEIYLRVGRLEEAFYYTEQALVSARAQHERGREAWLLRFLGEIVTRRDPLALDHAASYYQQALAIATELGMRPLQAHCHHGLGTLCRQMNREEQARAALSTAIDLYREMDMVFWLPTVEAALTVSSL